MKRLAVVRDYAELVAAILARRDELRITNETLEDVAGIQAGYASKVLAARPIKRLGLVSLGPVLGALGTALVLVEDDAAFRRVAGRLTPRQYRIRTIVGMGDFPWLLTADRGRKLAVIRMSKVSPRRRSQLARRASRARWRKPRR